MVSNISTTRQPVIILITLAFVASVSAYPALPAVVGRGLIAFVLPSAAAITFVLFESLWRHDFVRGGNGHAEAAYQSIVRWLIVFVLALHAVILIGILAGRDANMVRSVPLLPRAVPVLLGVTLIGVGNLLPRIGPNVVMGIRTSRSLRDRRIWSRTQRAAGYVAVGLGMVSIVSGALVPQIQLLLPILSGAGLIAVAALATTAWKYSREGEN